ncbi:hypothetical protein [Cytobacillus oceanisediminis]|uniref:hypothetical protein n=1 Tax=Cytobacillus oceanisediminis TaxID=665099 RepID=UPI00203B7204|nr:hypothetical protein [Cytobacillus oceanisediminis]MCM3404887.1 hypothetical protein [Cytobacillus oceanisediminis]
MKGLLLRAASSEAVLEMIYLDNKGSISQRRIKVLAVGEESFRAYCRKQQRNFLIRNILSVVPARKMRRGA